MNLVVHLHSRYLDTRLHRVWLDNANCVATFPLWNLSSQLVGYQQYRPRASKERKNDPRLGRYFTKIKDGKVGMWGLESFHYSNTLFLTEGIFDAARLSYLGYAAVALLSHDVSVSTASWLNIVRASRRVVAVCDSGIAGRRLSKYGTDYFVVEGCADLGEASDDYVRQVVKEYG
jgi:hypothetical protein